MSERSIITVPGRGCAAATADVATVDLSIAVTAPTVPAARTEAATVANRVFGTLQQLPNIKHEDIKTTSISLYPEYDYNNDTNVPRITGYKHTNSIQVTVADFDSFDSTIGELLEAAVEAGQNHININRVSFSLSPPVSHQMLVKARKQAAEDAMATALQYAQSFQCRLVKLLSIKDTSHGSPPVQHHASAGGMGYARQASNPTPIAASQIEVNASVTVEYLFESHQSR